MEILVMNNKFNKKITRIKGPFSFKDLRKIIFVLGKERTFNKSLLKLFKKEFGTNGRTLQNGIIIQGDFEDRLSDKIS